MSGRTAVEVAAAALTAIGAQPISSFDDGSTGAIAATQLYEDVVAAALAEHPWRFACGQTILNRLAAPPAGKEWAAAYQIPTEPTTLAIRAIKIGGINIPFDRYEDLILCNALPNDEVVADLIFRTNEAFWPPYFTLYVIYRLGSVLAGSVTRDAGIMEEMRKLAETQILSARAMDGQGRTVKRPQSVRRMLLRRR